MKMMGVLGGIGPQATMDFEQRVHRVSQERMPQQLVRGYPPMVVYYCRFPPVLLDADGEPRSPLRPEPRFLRAASELGALADFLVITANGPHVFQEEIERVSGRPLLSMVDLALDEVQRRRWTRLGVLGLGDPVVYTGRLEALGIDGVTIEPALRAQLDDAIFKLMEGNAGTGESAVATEAIGVLRRQAVDGVILGCTEIPLLLGDAAVAPDLIDPLQLLAEAAVTYSAGPD